MLIEHLKFKKDYFLTSEKNGLKPFLEIKKPLVVYQRLLKFYLLETEEHSNLNQKFLLVS